MPAYIASQPTGVIKFSPAKYNVTWSMAVLYQPVNNHANSQCGSKGGCTGSKGGYTSFQKPVSFLNRQKIKIASKLQVYK